jgi:hypothetical protein
MAQTFSCPQCGGPLDFKGGSDPTIKCQYCHNSVIVPSELRGSAPSHPQGTVTLADLASQSPQLAEMAKQIQRGRKIDAIKIFRELYNVGLKEAKDAVDDLMAGRAIVLPNK